LSMIFATQKLLRKQFGLGNISVGAEKERFCTVLPCGQHIMWGVW